MRTRWHHKSGRKLWSIDIFPPSWGFCGGGGGWAAGNGGKARERKMGGGGRGGGQEGRRRRGRMGEGEEGEGNTTSANSPSIAPAAIMLIKRGDAMQFRGTPARASSSVKKIRQNT